MDRKNNNLFDQFSTVVFKVVINTNGTHYCPNF